MKMQESFSSLMERLQSSANVKTVYGDPIETQGKTIIPAARIMYGFGGGSGRRNQEQREEGGGGGGGVRAFPVGVVEITPDSTRFIAFRPSGKLIAGIAFGILAGLAIGAKAKRLLR